MSVEFRVNQNNADEVLSGLQMAKLMALEMIGLQATGYAKGYSPVDTGRLRNSISYKVVDENAVAIGTNVEYAIYQEMGTSRMKAQPYLKPAVMEHLDEYKAMAESALKGV